MVDYHFHDIVQNSKEIKTFDDGVLVGRGWQAICKSCSTVHKTDHSEFDVPITTFDNGEKHIPIDEEVFRFVAEMRAWNCCHEGTEPYDGFPEAPETPYGIELGKPQRG